MQRFMAIFVLLVAATMISSCTTVRSPAVGIFYTEVSSGLDAEGSLGTKEGKACAESIMGLVATGDASIKAAAKAGGITKITNVDQYARHRVIIGEYCTIVRGD